MSERSGDPATSEPTDERPLRIGVVGVGRIGRMHAEMINHSVSGAALAGVFDPNHEATRGLARRLGVNAAGSVEELLAGEIDAVAICSSTESHTDLIVAAAEAGKAIFCEKPLSLDLVEVDRALSVVRTTGVPFQIGFNRRFDPAHESVRSAVRSGRIGEPHLLRISSRDPEPPSLEYVRASGGLLLDMTIHDFDMARFLTGSEVVEVNARGALRIATAFAEAGDVDTALVMLVHDNGCLTAIDNSRRAVYGYDQRVEVFGSEGMAASGNVLQHTGVVYTADGCATQPLQHFFLDRYTTSYLRQWDRFVSAVRSAQSSEDQLSDARAPLVMGIAAWRSLRERRPVLVSEVDV